MAIDDNVLFAEIMRNHKELSIDAIMDMYDIAKKRNIESEININKNAIIDVTNTAIQIEASKTEQQSAPEEKAKKKYIKRNLVVKPDEAITDDIIKCCLCKKEFKSLTSKHLATHGITVEEYKKLCGYGAEQKLMSNKHAEKMRDNINKAHQAKRNKTKESV